MIGAIVGDIAGSRFEWHNRKSKGFTLLKTLECYFTDDTVMSLAIAEALLDYVESGKKTELSRLAIQHMQELGRKYEHAGYGSSFHGWLEAKDPQPYNSWGNGAAMRVSACGWVSESLDETKKLSKAVTEVTHNHPEGIKGAEAVTVAIFMARKGCKKEEIRNYIEKNYYDLTGCEPDNIRETYDFDVSCIGTVPVAIAAFLEAEDFEDAIRNAVSIGGDSDTIAAITGSIAEAYFGVPSSIYGRAIRFLTLDLRAILKRFEKLYPSKIIEDNLDISDDLWRFEEIQEKNYPKVVTELKNGRKTTHWIWYIFPQLRGLGASSMSYQYAISDLEEARSYLKNRVLRERLIEVCRLLLKLAPKDIEEIVGRVDAMKICSCMTLFSRAEPSIEEFEQVLEVFYNGERCKRTLDLLDLELQTEAY